MEITEVRVKLVNGKNDKLRAFCSITIDDDFVIRDLKVIDGVKGPFVAMPSRKLMERCEKCSSKNHYRAKHCNECGTRLSRQGARRSESDGADEDGRSKLHTEIAHPINSGCREMIQRRVLMEYRRELEDQGDAGATSASPEGGFDDYFREGDRAPVHTSTETDSGGGKPAFDEPALGRWQAANSRSESQATSADEHRDRLDERVPKKSEDKEKDGDARKTRRLSDFEDAASKLDEEPEDNFGAGIFP